MILVTIREPILVAPRDPDELDADEAYRTAIASGWDESSAAAFAAWMLELPATFEATGPRPWTIREIRHLRFLAAEYDRGGFVGDREDGR